MPTPHIDETLKALSEDWFIGKMLGPKYAAVLRNEMDRRTDIPAIESALSLGG